MNTFVVVLAFLVALDPTAGGVGDRPRQRWTAAAVVGLMICALMISARMIADLLDSSTMVFGVAAGLLLTMSGWFWAVSAGPGAVVRSDAETLRSVVVHAALAVTPTVGFLAVASALDRGPLRSAACALPAIAAQLLPLSGSASRPAIRRLRGAFGIALGVFVTAQAIGGV